VTKGPLSPGNRCCELGRSGTGAPAMSIIPLHLQKRFEERWAARFGSLVIPAAPKSVGLKDSPSTLRRARQSQRKNRQVESAVLKSASTA
jgi:hypothetical protein